MEVQSALLYSMRGLLLKGVETEKTKVRKDKEEVKDFILFGKTKPYSKYESYMGAFRLWTILASIFWVGNSIYIAIFVYIG